MKIFHLPDLGEGLAEAEIREWYVKVGDEIKRDQPLVAMETAKALVDVPSPQTGKVIKLYGNPGDIIQTKAPLVEFAEADPLHKDKGTVVGKLEEGGNALQEGEMIIGSAKQKAAASHVKIMPAVRALAAQLQVDLTQVIPTGAQGQITAEDVKRAMPSAAPIKPAHPVEKLQSVRRGMAMVMTQAHQQVVPVTLMDDADITHLGAQGDITIAILQAMLVGIKAEPALNAWYDSQTLERCVYQEVHFGIAMDTKEGLFVPVIKHAEQKKPAELRQALDGYKQAVRERSVAPSDLQGATITLSNFGLYAGRYATPIVVPPQVAILACGKAREEPTLAAGQLVMRRLLPLSLTVDHRVVTGGEAARFLASVINSLTSPA